RRLTGRGAAAVLLLPAVARDRGRAGSAFGGLPRDLDRRLRLSQGPGREDRGRYRPIRSAGDRPGAPGRLRPGGLPALRRAPVGTPPPAPPPAPPPPLPAPPPPPRGGEGPGPPASGPEGSSRGGARPPPHTPGP